MTFATRSTAAAVLFALLGLPCALAQTVDLHFDNIPGMTNAVGAVVPTASRLSSQLIATHGVSFSSQGGFVAVVNHGALTPSVPNILGGSTTNGTLSYATGVTFAFFDPAHPTVQATTDFVRIRGDLSAIPGTATMKAFDVAGQLLAAQTVPDVSTGLVLSIATAGIHRVELSQTSNTIGFDDLSFHAVVPTAGFASYCTSGTTSNGCRATIGANGTPSASLASPFQITVTAVEGEKQGLIFYGLAASALAWGPGSTSFLCVKLPTQRTPAQNSQGVAGQCNGALALDWNAFALATPAALGAPFSPGQPIYAQGWFRDPAAAKTTSLSDAPLFVLAP